ncbi:MAG: tyrosine-type recombinase/integrase [Candidatus Acidiferrales bacterium]
MQVKPGDHHTPQVAVAYHTNGRPKSNAAIIGGKEVPVVCVRNFYVRYSENGKRQIENVGSDPIAAVRAAERKEAELNARKFGIMPAPAPTPRYTEAPSGRVRLADAIDAYVAEIKVHKRPKTYDAYRRALEMFRAGCQVEYVDEIGRQCVLAFKAGCQREYESVFTVRNFFAYVITFLNRHGKKGLMSKTDWPKPERNEYEPPSDADIEKMLAACRTDKERVLVRFARETGFRKSEIIFSEIGDVNFDAEEIRTRSKPHLGFLTKDSEERTVPVTPGLIAALKSYAKTLDGSKLLFSRRDGGPDLHIDRVMARIYKRSGVAVPKKPLHGLRVAYACALCRAGIDVSTIQHQLGHSDVQTTQGYLRAVRRQDPTLRKRIRAAFAG